MPAPGPGLLSGPLEVPGAAETRLAWQTAAHLLTTRPVCVLGAGTAPFGQRLRFLDLVMSRLPYGARSQMSAATLVNPVYAGHRHRLYFASAPRPAAPGREPDICVQWDRPDTGFEPSPEAAESLRWAVPGRLQTLPVLAREKTPLNLKSREEIRDMIGRVRRVAEAARMPVRPARSSGPGTLER